MIKKYFFILILTCNVLLLAQSNVFETYNAQFAQAKKVYDAKDFAQSFMLFEKLVKIAPDSAEINFFLGRSALETKRYNEALAAFERVLMLNPAHHRSRLEIARTYYELGQFALASSTLERVLSANLPEDIRKVTVAFKKHVDSKQTKHSIRGTVMTGVGYDSNANNDIGKRGFIVPAFNVSVSGNDEVEDYLAFVSATLNHSYDFGESKGWRTDQSLVAYLKGQKKQDNNNLGMVSLGIAPTWQGERLQMSFPFKYDRVALDYDGYVTTLGTGIRIDYLLGKTTSINTAYRFKRSYYDETETKDSQSHQVSFGLQHVFNPENPWVLGLNVSRPLDQRVKGTRTDVASDNWRYGVTLARELVYGVRANLGVVYATSDYKEADVLFGTKRKDKRYEYSLGLSRSVAKDTILALSFAYIDNGSNHEPFVYDKYTATATVVWGF